MGANDDRDRRALPRHRGGGHAQRRQGISQRRDVLRRRRQGQAPPLRAAGARLRPDQPAGRAIASADLKGTCTTVSFDGSKSYDVAGRPVSYVWRFGDGESQDGPTAVHDYKIEGRIEASLEAIDTAPQLGNGSVVSLMVFVKKPPVALSDKRVLVAQGETTWPSTAPHRPPASGRSRKITGTSATAPRYRERKSTHAFAKPGVYEVTHTVVDDSGHPCNTATEKFSVRVNAQPVAEAGPDQHVSVDQEVAFDAGASTDSDGKIVDYQWDFGDGSKASGAKVTHKYAKAATYKVTLAIRDNSDVLNSGAGDSLADHRQRSADSRGGRRQIGRDRRAPHLRRLGLGRPRRHASSPMTGISATAARRPASRSRTPTPSRALIPSS